MDKILREDSSDAMKVLTYTIEQSEKKSKRDFIIIVILILALTVSVGYNIYLSNSINTVETTSSTIDLDNIDTIEQSEIHN